jgi:hypothetical protein
MVRVSTPVPAVVSNTCFGLNAASRSRRRDRQIINPTRS